MSVTADETTVETRPPAVVAKLPAPVLPPPRRATRNWASGLAQGLQTALDHRRTFLLWPYATVAGLIAWAASPFEPDRLALVGAGALLALIALLSLRRLGRLRLVGIAIAFWLGLALLPLHSALFGTPMLARATYGTYEMRVDEILSEVDSGLRVIVSAIAPQGQARDPGVRRARLVVADAGDLAPGDIVRAPVRFYPVPGPVVPNGHDTQFHAFFDGIGAYGSTTDTVERVATGPAGAPDRVIDGIRRGIADRIDTHLQQPAAGIARALITGDQSAVPEQARETMATAGLAHVLSVSGLHLTIVAGLVLVTLRVGLAPFSALHGLLSVKRIAAAGAVLAALAYFAISGGNVAALRSTIMLVLILGAVIFGRRPLTMRNVAIAALIVIATDPASVFRPSFQLSFAAVVALIAAWELMRPPDDGKRSIPSRILGYLWGIALTSLVAGAATLLFSIYHFQQTSPLGVLGNLFSLPLVGFVMMPAAVIGTLLMPLGWEGPALAVMGWSIDRMLDLGQLVAGWSGGLDYSPLLAPLALGIGLVAFAWFTFVPTWHRLLAPALAIPAVLLLALDHPPDVLIADTTQAVAMRTENGLALVAGKSDSFAVDVWRETYSDPIEAGSPMRCDSLGCFGGSPRGFTVAIARDTAAFHEDCGTADLVILRVRAPGTCAATVIDADTLAAGGVHWVRWDAGRANFEVRPAIPAVRRPWRAAPP